MAEIVKLSNGLTIVMEKITYIRSIAFGIWVKNGSRNENISNNGISHFIEHMLFKGTDKRTAKQIADEIDGVGGQLNAYTSKEYTCYYTKTLDYHFDIALDVMADMYFNSKFDEAEIAKERNVILEEISMYEDTPDELVHDLLHLNIWKGDSLGLPILGTEQSISSLNRATFKDYMHDKYCSDNTVIAMVGNFDEKEIVKKIEKYFLNSKFQYSAAKYNASAIYKPNISAKQKDIEQVHIVMGFPSIELGSQNSYALAALNTIFGGGMSSRLFQTIREENGLSYSVYSYNSGYADTGLFSIYAGLNSSQTKQVIRLILQEIKRLEIDRITEAQLESTKEQLKSNYLLSLENSLSIMNALGRSKLMLDKILTPDEIISRIDNVSLESIYKLTAEIFDFDKLSLSVVGNFEDIDFKELINSAV